MDTLEYEQVRYRRARGTKKRKSFKDHFAEGNTTVREKEAYKRTRFNYETWEDEDGLEE